MKHKYIFRTMTALCAALLIVGGLSVPAYAQTPEGQDATNDDNVIVEQPEEEYSRIRDGLQAIPQPHNS